VKVDRASIVNAWLGMRLTPRQGLQIGPLGYRIHADMNTDDFHRIAGIRMAVSPDIRQIELTFDLAVVCFEAGHDSQGVLLPFVA